MTRISRIKRICVIRVIRGQFRFGCGSAALGHRWFLRFFFSTPSESVGSPSSAGGEGWSRGAFMERTRILMLNFGVGDWARSLRSVLHNAQSFGFDVTEENL